MPGILGTRAEVSVKLTASKGTQQIWAEMAAVGFRLGGDGEMDKTDCGLGGELGREKCIEMDS